MTLRELIDLETEKTIDEYNRGIDFYHGCKFLMISLPKDLDIRYKSIISTLNSLDIKLEENYGDYPRGYIWLRFDFREKRFKSYLNFYEEGYLCNRSVYNSTDFVTPGQILDIRCQTGSR